jgi:hypothetical protein
MSGAEVPGFDNETASPLESDLRDFTDALKETLEFCRPAEVMTHTFSYCGDELSEVVMPNELHRLVKHYGPLDAVDIECTYLHGSGPSYDIQFLFCDEAFNVTRLRVSRPYNYQSTPADYDYVYSGESDEDDPDASISNVKPINQGELNRCIASLIYNDFSLGIAALDASNWFPGDHDRLTTALGGSATTSTGSREYLFTDEQGGPAGSFGYEEENGIVTELNIYRIDKQNVEVHGDGTLSYYEKAVEASLDGKDATDVLFNDHYHLDGEYYSKFFRPSNDDFQKLFEFINKQIEIAHTDYMTRPVADTAEPVE